MPKEIYINKSVLNTTASISAFGNSGRNYLTQSDQEADYNNYSESCLTYPCIETVYIDKPITFSNAITNRGTNIIDVSILMTTYASANGIDFTNSTFYKNRDKFSDACILPHHFEPGQDRLRLQKFRCFLCFLQVSVGYPCKHHWRMNRNDSLSLHRHL